MHSPLPSNLLMSKQFLATSDDLSGIRTRQLILPVVVAAPERRSDTSGSRTPAPRSAGALRGTSNGKLPPSGEYPGPPGRHNHVDDSDRSRRDLILGLLIAAVLAAMVALAL
jgi:hypothetical protein